MLNNYPYLHGEKARYLFPSFNTINSLIGFSSYQKRFFAEEEAVYTEAQYKEKFEKEYNERFEKEFQPKFNKGVKDRVDREKKNTAQYIELLEAEKKRGNKTKEEIDALNATIEEKEKEIHSKDDLIKNAKDKVETEWKDKVDALKQVNQAQLDKIRGGEIYRAITGSASTPKDEKDNLIAFAPEKVYKLLKDDVKWTQDVDPDSKELIEGKFTPSIEMEVPKESDPSKKMVKTLSLADATKEYLRTNPDLLQKSLKGGSGAGDANTSGGNGEDWRNKSASQNIDAGIAAGEYYKGKDNEEN